MSDSEKIVLSAKQIYEKNKRNMLDLIVKKGNYSTIEDVSYEQFENLISKDTFPTLDLFCPRCMQEKTFLFNSCAKRDYDSFLTRVTSNGTCIYIYSLRELVYKCPTCGKEIVYYFYHDREKNRIIKIGQYPSVYDISRDELKEFQKSKIISDEDIKQLYKAYACASESFFVAAYAYLRRVFENLLINVFFESQSEIGCTEEEFRKLRSDEKLKKIKDYLAIDEEIYHPLYALLSEGIHSLTEDECGDNFELLKSILLDILHEQRAKKEKMTNRKQIQTLYAKRKVILRAGTNATDERQ